ncbi:MAG: hypothetical protein JKY67_13490 [Pseudomonadales bacterium]|nr:hypothetical protein [Pseudomonadales bacterium]
MPSDTDELISIQKKRDAIEKLVAFSQQLSKLVNTMESVQHMMRPSQIPKKGRFALLHQLIDRLQTVETEQLYTRLDKLDKEVGKEIKKILALSQLKEADIEKSYVGKSREEIELGHRTMLKELKDFSRKTQTNVAIRYTLHNRGCSLDSAKLPIFQEELGVQVENLKSQEHQCRNKLAQHLESLIHDTDLILNAPHFPDEVKQQVATVKADLEKNLEHIRDGKNIDGIPVFIESLEIAPSGTIDLPPIGANPFEETEADAQDDASKDVESVESLAPETENQILENQTTSDSTTLKELQSQYRQKGFFGRLWMWLNTPLGVSWGDISKQSKDS